MPDRFDEKQAVRWFDNDLMPSRQYRCYVFNDRNPQTNLTPTEYLRNKLFGSCFQFTHTHYWYYDFCPFNNLQQYRFAENNQTRIDIFNLGKDSSIYSIEGHLVYGIWTDGDYCVVTRKPRTTRIEFVCDMSEDSDGSLISISESSICNYLVRFHTPHACAFKNITNERLSEIVCVNKTVIDLIGK